jgi:CubicO group peptidase (beta-lactamase class C family)
VSRIQSASLLCLAAFPLLLMAVTPSRGDAAPGAPVPKATAPSPRATPSSPKATIQASKINVANWYWGPANQWSWHHTRRLFPSENISRGTGPVSVLENAPRDVSNISFDDPVSKRRMTIGEMLQTTYTDGFIVLKDGKIVTEQYFNGMKPGDPHLVMSVTKSFVGALAGILADRRQLDVDALITDYLPELKGTAYDGATVRNALDMTVATILDDDVYKRIDQAVGWVPADDATSPGLLAFLTTLTRKNGPHGAKFLYLDPSPQVIGWIMERATRTGVGELLQDEIWSKLGAEYDGYILLDAHQEAFAPAGLNVTLRDLARFGQMILQHGRYNGQQIVPRHWVDDIRTGGDLDAWRAGHANSGDDKLLAYDNGSYRSFWWVADRSCGRFAAIGLGGQTVIVDPMADMVVVKFSSSPDAPAGAKITRTEFSAADAIIRTLSGHGC